MEYWVAKRYRSDHGVGGYRSMYIVAGPFADGESAWAKQRELMNRLSEVEQMTGNPNYWVLSDAEIAQGRAMGINIS